MTFRLFNLAKQLCYANFFTPQLPYKLTFALTYRCNLKCQLCRSWARPERKELSLEEIRSILDSFTNLGWLHFTGGEIFLRDDIAEILQAAVVKKSLAVLTLPTNGILVERIIDVISSLVERLKGVKLVITCSLDGPSETHNWLKGKEGSYERCVETFSRLRRISGVDTYIGVTVSRYNYRKLPELFSGLREKIPNLEFSRFHFNFAEQSSFYNLPVEPSGNLLDQEVYSYCQDMLQIYRPKKKGVKGFLEKKYFAFMPGYLESGRTPLGCSAAWGSCFVDPYGDVYPCINYLAKLGNLAGSAYDLPAFWRSTQQIRGRIKKTITEKRCPHCWTPCEAYPAILSRMLWS